MERNDPIGDPPEQLAPADADPLPDEPEVRPSIQERIAARLRVYEDVPVVGLGVALFRRDVEAGGSLAGSAVAFRLFTFFVPLLLFVVGLAGLLGRYSDPDAVTDDMGVTSALAAQMQTALEQRGGTSVLLLLLGLLGILVSGRALGVVMIAASCAAWRVPIDGRVPWRIVGSIAGLVSGMGLMAILLNKIRVELGLPAAGLSLGGALVVYATAWLVLTWMLPRGTDDPGALLPGSVFMAAVIACLHAVGQWYLPGRFERASQLFGAIGVTVVTLGWFFLIGRAAVISMEINSVVYERIGSLSQVVFGLPVLRSLAHRSSRLRRFFALDEAAGPPAGAA